MTKEEWREKVEMLCPQDASLEERIERLTGTKLRRLPDQGDLEVYAMDDGETD